jgi:hypothetical protein
MQNLSQRRHCGFFGRFFSAVRYPILAIVKFLLNLFHNRTYHLPCMTKTFQASGMAFGLSKPERFRGPFPFLIKYLKWYAH